MACCANKQSIMKVIGQPIGLDRSRMIVRSARTSKDNLKVTKETRHTNDVDKYRSGGTY